MAQIFSSSANTLARASPFVLILLISGAAWANYRIFWSPYTTWQQIPLEQPVPFSHRHHVAEIGIDCRYCHAAVEKSSFAGLPSTETCMTCHSRLWNEAPMLEPVRDSLAQKIPIQWTRVNNIPDFVYFDHSIHVAKGVGCATCHGPVDQMPLTWRENTLYMKWCLDCHRSPETFIRPQSEVFNMHWDATKQKPAGASLVKAYHVDVSRMTDCSVCHR